MRLNLNDRDAYNDRAVAYSALGDFDQALADFDEVVRLSPDDPLGYINYAGAKGSATK
ncbi:tetratricopeptide repeat protein [Halomicronema sp. CCY15110]|uniref:tetratricopeptide repeat protein n=1 Tax=Halomicronema sp. CCY15110 TaxID=2767773 RepID=UPI0035CD078F